MNGQNYSIPVEDGHSVEEELELFLRREGRYAADWVQLQKASRKLLSAGADHSRQPDGLIQKRGAERPRRRQDTVSESTCSQGERDAELTCANVPRQRPALTAQAPTRRRRSAARAEVLARSPLLRSFLEDATELESVV